jgi:protein-S-isoprenylcysteine O-methyltransferase Ste14
MTNDNEHTKKLHGRDDLSGEHRVGDIGQMTLAIIFFAVWVTDSFFAHYSTMLDPYIPVTVKIPLAVIVLILSAFLAGQGMYIVFIKKRQQPGVIRNGVFGFLRHPIYFSEVLLYLGLLLLHTSLAAIFIWIIIIFFLYYISRYEEKLLLLRFGDEYRQYMKDVGMWIPRPRCKKSS